MKIEVWSDFVCPFCYIGKRKLEKALESFPHTKNVSIEYKSYELNKDGEKNPGISIHEALSQKYGVSVEEARTMNENIAMQASEVGLQYHFDSMKPANTFDAHRLAKFAAKKGKGAEMTERLLKAYFTDSKLISDYATLVDLAEEVGLSREEAEEMLHSETYSFHVRADEKQAEEIGVQGVPFFVFNEKYAVSGAQPVEVFSEVLERVWQEQHEKPVLQSLNPQQSETTYCTDEGCEVKRK
ncbi:MULTISPECIES: DsbA family oxidoreductase [unclassified Virgibacillus]|uniref:DsbA family oxidoreductase n=1 Tax=unclassified Virgibacillus TaxID=2620237 RepID=UPI0024DE7AF7|nr:DsbA family oxidoreductase [Virgibacillus sp. LDC-1]